MAQTVVTIREYARLTTEAVPPSLDQVQLSVSAFEWLCELASRFSKSGVTLLHREGKRVLRWDNYVGVLDTPCGTRLEILPKHVDDGSASEGSAIERTRALLRRMIQVALAIPPRQASVTQLHRFTAPLSEWVMGQFLAELDRLLKRGLRFDYQRIEEEQRYLRGQLNITAQMRQAAGRQHHLPIRHDVFLPDRAENRLLKTALERVAQHTQEPQQWRLAHELRTLLQEIPPSERIENDLRQWSLDRLMAHYAAVKPWCELVLSQQMPLAVSGDWHGISLLFPMERLFERYVEIMLRRQLPTGAQLLPQRASQYLCEHHGGRMFQLKPDLLLRQGTYTTLLDTKWKRIDASRPEAKYGLSQGDFYQMFAYGQRYLQGNGPMALVYPHCQTFTSPLPVFKFTEHLQLWVLPFDLETGTLDGLDRLLAPAARSH